MTMTVTNNDLGGLYGNDAEFQDDVLTFGGADTFAAGTILARDSVSKKLVLYAKGGSTNENGIPKAILPYALTAAGSGDKQVRVLVKGAVRFDKLVIDADGDNSNVDAPVLDQLRDYGITAVKDTELLKQDNQ